jgi:hypothetical protein
MADMTDQLNSLQNEVVAVREENAQLRNLVEERLEARDRVLMET